MYPPNFNTLVTDLCKNPLGAESCLGLESRERGPKKGLGPFLSQPGPFCRIPLTAPSPAA
jgi:hypothetical protein